jgi:predicted phosphodiesterase
MDSGSREPHGMTALLADIHGNSAALRAVLEDVRGFGADRIVALGDVINGPDPRGCMEALLPIPGIRFLAGNAEEYIRIEGLEEFPLRGESFYPSLMHKLLFWKAALGRDLMEEIRRWPGELADGDMLCVHDSPAERLLAARPVAGLDPRFHPLMFHGRGIGASLSDAKVAEAVAPARERGFARVACGHTHEAFLRTAGGVTVCNAGSVGMPLDGDPRPSWVSLVDGSFAIHRVPYDVEEAIAFLDATGMPLDGLEAGYKETLRTGRFSHRRTWPGQ